MQRPSIVVVSRTRLIYAELTKEGYKVRPDAAAILAVVDRLPR